MQAAYSVGPRFVQEDRTEDRSTYSIAQTRQHAWTEAAVEFMDHGERVCG